jgi:RNA polymerase sigma factor (sigma-70 family)
MDNAVQLSLAALIRQCGHSDDPQFWRMFLQRCHRQVLLYVYRRCQLNKNLKADSEVLNDLAQEVYMYLLSNNRRALREFRGDTDASVQAYLAQIVRSVVVDHLRKRESKKRMAVLVSLDQEVGTEDLGHTLAAILPAKTESQPDQMLEERLASEQLHKMLLSILSGKNATRDALIFRLHVLQELTVAEIANLPTFAMSVENVEVIIRRTREKLRRAFHNQASRFGV